MNQGMYSEIKTALRAIENELRQLNSKFDQMSTGLVETGPFTVTDGGDLTGQAAGIQAVTDAGMVRLDQGVYNEYDVMTVPEIVELSPSLHPGRRAMLLEYERANKNRAGAIRALGG